MDFQDQAARRRPRHSEAVYTGFKGVGRYLLSISHTPLEHKRGVNRTPPQELNGNKSTTKGKSETSRRITGLLTQLQGDKTELKPETAIADVTEKEKKKNTKLRESLGGEQRKRRSVTLQTAHPLTCGLSLSAQLRVTYFNVFPNDPFFSP